MRHRFSILIDDSSRDYCLLGKLSRPVGAKAVAARLDVLQSKAAVRARRSNGGPLHPTLIRDCNQPH